MWRGTRTLHGTRYITTNPSVAAVNGDSFTVLSGFNEDFHLHHFYVHSNPLDCLLYATLRHCYSSMLCFFLSVCTVLLVNHFNIRIAPAGATAGSVSSCLLSRVDIGQWWCLNSACSITETKQGTRAPVSNLILLPIIVPSSCLLLLPRPDPPVLSYIDIPCERKLIVMSSLLIGH